MGKYLGEEGAKKLMDYVKANRANISPVVSKVDRLDTKVTGIEQQVTSYKPIVVNNSGTINNLADEEDLTIDQATNVLRLANRSSIDGMGYVILRKEKTFAEQITEANTIYEIRYDFDLNESVIALAKNITLYFNGGSVQNGMLTNKDITSQVTIQTVYSKKPIFVDTILLGHFHGVGYDWMTQDTQNTDDYLALNNLLQFHKSVIEAGELNITHWYNPYYEVGSPYFNYRPTQNAPFDNSNINCIDTRSDIDLEGNGAIININVTEEERVDRLIGKGLSYIWGIPCRPLVTVYPSNRNCIKLSNINIIDDKSINENGCDFSRRGFSSDYAAEVGHTYSDGSTEIHGNIFNVSDYSGKFYLDLESVNYIGKYAFMGGEFGDIHNTKKYKDSYINNCSFRGTSTFGFELWSQPHVGINNLYVNNTTFKDCFNFFSNSAVSKNQYFSNCLFEQSFRIASGSETRYMGTKDYYKNCTFKNGAGYLFNSPTSGACQDVELENCDIIFESGTYTGFPYYALVSGKTLMKKCRISIGDCSLTGYSGIFPTIISEIVQNVGHESTYTGESLKMVDCEISTPFKKLNITGFENQPYIEFDNVSIYSPHTFSDQEGAIYFLYSPFDTTKKVMSTEYPRRIFSRMKLNTTDYQTTDILNYKYNNYNVSNVARRYGKLDWMKSYQDLLDGQGDTSNTNIVYEDFGLLSGTITKISKMDTMFYKDISISLLIDIPDLSVTGESYYGNLDLWNSFKIGETTIEYFITNQYVLGITCKNTDNSVGFNYNFQLCQGLKEYVITIRDKALYLTANGNILCPTNEINICTENVAFDGTISNFSLGKTSSIGSKMKLYRFSIYPWSTLV